MIGKRIAVIVGVGLAAGCHSGRVNTGVTDAEPRAGDAGTPPSCGPASTVVFEDPEPRGGFRDATSFGPAEGFVRDVTADTLTVQVQGESRVFRWEGPDLRARFLVNEEVTVSARTDGTDDDRSVRRHVVEGSGHRAVAVNARLRGVPTKPVSVRVQEGPLLSVTNSIVCIRTRQTETRCGRRRSTTIWDVRLGASAGREAVELERGETTMLGEWHVTSLGAASKRSPAVLALGCVLDAAGAATLWATALGPTS